MLFFIGRGSGAPWKAATWLQPLLKWQRRWRRFLVRFMMGVPKKSPCDCSATSSGPPDGVIPKSGPYDRARSQWIRTRTSAKTYSCSCPTRKNSPISTARDCPAISKRPPPLDATHMGQTGKERDCSFHTLSLGATVSEILRRVAGLDMNISNDYRRAISSAPFFLVHVDEEEAVERRRNL